MKILKSLSELESEKNVSITFGNFDGVHLGHRDLIKGIQEESKNLNLELVVVTFVPHPSLILSPKTNFLICSYERRREILEKIGVDYLLELDFSRDLSTLTPENFFDQHIFLNSNIKKVYIGYDFVFGANKAGDANFVKSYCKNKGVDFNVQSEFKCNGKTVSSTLIRDKISSGEIEAANTYLDRIFTIRGRVVKGVGRGKKIGFPTANLDFLPERLVPARGVYISQVSIGERRYNSVTNVGLNPTFEENDRLMIETHILDFDEDIYGDDILVFFKKRLRDEKKFDSVNSLVEQIKKDVFTAREFFEND